MKEKERWDKRSRLLLKDSGVEKLSSARVLVVGLGGVGAFAAEFLARAGVGSMTIVDADTVSTTNINRQLLALHSTVGQGKAHLMAERLRDINPNIDLCVVEKFLRPDDARDIIDTS